MNFSLISLLIWLCFYIDFLKVISCITEQWKYFTSCRSFKLLETSIYLLIKLQFAIQTTICFVALRCQELNSMAPRVQPKVHLYF